MVNVQVHGRNRQRRQVNCLSAELAVIANLLCQRPLCPCVIFVYRTLMNLFTPITTTSCAKLNLGLSLIGTRTDGYHDLDSVFVEIDLCDSVTIEPWTDLTCESHPAVTSDPHDNLIYRAGLLLSKRILPTAGAKITVHKRIPTGAGLGGGSSNAACALRHLYEGWTGTPATTAEAIAVLEPVAQQLGSDVSFFLHGGVAHVTGRGEVVHPLPLHLPWSFLVVLPGIHIPTADAYRSLRTSLNLPAEGPWHRPTAHPLATLVTALKHDGEGLHALRNDFEPYAFATYPVLSEICRTLQSSGALYAGMSGSGSTMFGVFRTATEARAAGERLSFHSYVCRQREGTP